MKNFYLLRIKDFPDQNLLGLKEIYFKILNIKTIRNMCIKLKNISNNYKDSIYIYINYWSERVNKKNQIPNNITMVGIQ